MKILVLSSHTPSLFWFRMDMMKDFIDLGYKVVAVGNESKEKWDEKFLKEGIVYRQVDIERNGTNPVKDLKTLRELKKIIREELPDKIFAYQAKTVIYGGIAVKNRKNIEFYPLIAGIGSAFLAKNLKGKIIKKILVAEYKIALRKASAVFFQNSDDVREFIDNGIIKKKKLIILNGSGVNLEKFTPQKLPSKIAFLCISRLIRDKGIIEYLEAARIVKAKYNDVRFLLVGPFDSNPSALREKDLKDYIEDGTIEYFGEQTDVRPYFAQSSVFVLPSYREGTPKTVLEAMACCKAIITTDAPGCRETVENEVNGFLVPIKDIKAIVEKMIYFINHSEQIEIMALEGRRLVEKKFDVKKVNQTIIQTMRLEKK